MINRHINTQSPSQNEVINAIKKLKMNESAVSEGISAELLTLEPRSPAVIILLHIVPAWTNHSTLN